MSNKRECRVVGEVAYREGDGMMMQVPVGPCEVELTEADATLVLERRRQPRRGDDLAVGVRALRASRVR